MRKIEKDSKQQKMGEFNKIIKGYLLHKRSDGMKSSLMPKEDELENLHNALLHETRLHQQRRNELEELNIRGIENPEMEQEQMEQERRLSENVANEDKRLKSEWNKYNKLKENKRLSAFSPVQQESLRRRVWLNGLRRAGYEIDNSYDNIREPWVVFKNKDSGEIKYINTETGEELVREEDIRKLYKKGGNTRKRKKTRKRMVGKKRKSRRRKKYKR